MNYSNYEEIDWSQYPNPSDYKGIDWNDCTKDTQRAANEIWHLVSAQGQDAISHVYYAAIIHKYFSSQETMSKTMRQYKSIMSIHSESWGKYALSMWGKDLLLTNKDLVNDLNELKSRIIEVLEPEVLKQMQENFDDIDFNAHSDDEKLLLELQLVKTTNSKGCHFGLHSPEVITISWRSQDNDSEIATATKSVADYIVFAISNRNIDLLKAK